MIKTKLCFPFLSSGALQNAIVCRYLYHSSWCIIFADTSLVAVIPYFVRTKSIYETLFLSIGLFSTQYNYTPSLLGPPLETGDSSFLTRDQNFNSRSFSQSLTPYLRKNCTPQNRKVNMSCSKFAPVGLSTQSKEV